MTNQERNQQYLKEYLDKAGQWEALATYCHPDIDLPHDIENREIGLEAMRPYYARQENITTKVSIEDFVSEGDCVVARLKITGSQIGVFKGIPNKGNSFEIEEIMLTQWREGKMYRVRRVADMMSLYQQLIR